MRTRGYSAYSMTSRFWDVRQAKPAHTVETPGPNINLTYSQDGNTVAVGDRTDLISFIDTRTYAIVHQFRSKIEVNEMIFSPDGRAILLSTGEGTVEIHAYPALNLLEKLNAHSSQVFCLALDSRGRYLATGGADALVCLWDTEEWYCQKTLGKFDYPVRALSFSWDGEYLASASEEHIIDIVSPFCSVSIVQQLIGLSVFCPDRYLDTQDPHNGSYQRSRFSSDQILHRLCRRRQGVCVFSDWPWWYPAHRIRQNLWAPCRVTISLQDL